MPPETMTQPQSTDQAVSGQSQSVAPAQEVPDPATYLMQYAKQNPDVAAMACFGAGFLLGWKLKPW